MRLHTQVSLPSVFRFQKPINSSLPLLTGMISSAFLWGFLSDVLGRKMLLVYGYLLDAMFNICSAFSQSFVAILVFKFMGGFMWVKRANLPSVTLLDVWKFFSHSICGPFAVLMSYLSELHGLKYRSRVMMSTGIFFSIASIILPSLAWAIIPHPRWNFKIVEDYFGEAFSDLISPNISPIIFMSIQSSTHGRRFCSFVPCRVFWAGFSFHFCLKVPNSSCQKDGMRKQWKFSKEFTASTWERGTSIP